MRERRITVRGIELAYVERGDADAPTVLLLHATGFHARCWDGVVRALDEAGSGAALHIVALDQRGHGRSAKRRPYEWAEFGADAAAFAEALDLRDVVGVGHSMGGHALVQATGRHPGRFRALLLVDPVIMDPAAYRAAQAFQTSNEHPVARRRNRWSSPEEMFERFRNRHPFSLWDPAVLLDYCRFGLVAEGDGFVLACPPSVEASIYLGSAGRDIRNTIARIEQPVVVLRAKSHAESDGTLDFSRSPTWPGLAAAFANGRDVHLPALTHFMPMQSPALVAAHIRDLVRRFGNA